MVENGVGCIVAARHVFGWKCIPGTSEYRKATVLKNSSRVRSRMQSQHEAQMKTLGAAQLITNPKDLNIDSIYKYCFKLLESRRDNSQAPPNIRYKAIQYLEKLYDPSGDVGLIMRWMDLLWRASLTHCPCCHETFPLSEIQNPKLDEWRIQSGQEPLVVHKETLDRKMEIFKRAETRKKPHKSQVIALAAGERDVVGLGAARGGKSFLLAVMALMAFMIPGVEAWILARVYGDAKYEIIYLTGFLEALFYPHFKKLITVSEDKSGEYTFTARWGSVLRVKSAQARGSISGAELEFAGIAEPGWVDDTILGQLRARMSSRLGRTVMLGTPQGFGGILGRMVHAVGRSPVTGQMVRIEPKDRLLAAGCPWNYSMNLYQMDPNDNPEYVQSEREAARFMLTDAEYDTEFSGLMVSTDGSKFPAIIPSTLVRVEKDTYNNCKFVLGVDQGPKNFAACLIAFNGRQVYVVKDYFEKDDKTMKYHLDVLRTQVPQWIQRLTGGFATWNYTIFDVDPKISPELEELDAEGKPWPSEYTWRPKGVNSLSWRPETYEYTNNLAVKGNLLFDENCQILHDQMMRAQNKIEETQKFRDTSPDRKKGWIVNDPYRGDHVCDALIMALWTIYSNQVMVPISNAVIEKDPWSEARASQAFQLAMDERRELTGRGATRAEENSMFEKQFGRPRRTKMRPLYSDY
jgi:hypothetical protein